MKYIKIKQNEMDEDIFTLIRMQQNMISIREALMAISQFQQIIFQFMFAISSWVHDTLTNYGLDPFLIHVFVAVFITLSLLFSVLSLYGIFSKVELREEKLPKMHIVYKEKTGKYEGDKQVFNQILKDTRDTFKISKFFGIYYDDPIDADPAKCRSIIGVIVNEGEDFKISQFVSQNKSYSQAYTRPTKCYSYNFPLISSLSFNIASFKVYRKLKSLKQKKEQVRLSDFTIQIYNGVPKFWNKSIQVVSVSENFADFCLYQAKQDGNENQNQNEMREEEQN